MNWEKKEMKDELSHLHNNSCSDETIDENKEEYDQGWKSNQFHSAISLIFTLFTAIEWQPIEYFLFVFIISEYWKILIDSSPILPLHILPPYIIVNTEYTLWDEFGHIGNGDESKRNSWWRRVTLDRGKLSYRSDNKQLRTDDLRRLTVQRNRIYNTSPIIYTLDTRIGRFNSSTDPMEVSIVVVKNMELTKSQVGASSSIPWRANRWAVNTVSTNWKKFLFYLLFKKNSSLSYHTTENWRGTQQLIIIGGNERGD